MKKLDRFIIKSFVAPFMAALVVVVFILLLQFLEPLRKKYHYQN